MVSLHSAAIVCFCGFIRAFQVAICFLIWSAPLSPASDEPPAAIRFIYKDPFYMTAGQQAAWEEQVRTTPNIDDVLIDELWRSVDAGKEGWYKPILIALQYREHLSPDHLQQIRERILLLSSNDIQKYDAEEYWQASWFICPAIAIFKKYPSPENEELALSLLNNQSDFLVRVNAAITLGSIGTVRSLEAVRQFANSIRTRTGGGGTFYDDVLRAQNALEQRVAQNDTVLTQELGREELSSARIAERMAKDIGSPPKTVTSHGLVFAVGAFLVLISLVCILYWKARKRDGEDGCR